MLSENEIKKTIEISVNKDIVNIEYIGALYGEESDQRTDYFKRQLDKILAENESKKFKILIDFSQLGNNKIYRIPVKSRKQYADIAANRQIAKIAVVTISLVIKTMVGFVISFAGREGDCQIFTNKQEAIEWLNSKNY